MSLQPSLEEQELLAETFRRRGSGLNRREFLVDGVFATALAASVVALWLLCPPGSFAVGSALACVCVLVAATLVRIETPLGFTVPTQLAFVPLLFSVPVAIVPILVALALTTERVARVVRGEVHATRLLGMVCSAWFSVGPVAVFAISGVAPGAAGPALLLAALGAQFAVDFGVSGLRMLVARDAPVSSQLSESWVYGIDAALSGLGLFVAKNMHSSPLGPLALLPLLGVLALLARERHQRLTGLLELNGAYRGTALVLGDVVEADDGYTGEHCRSVVELAIEVGRRLGLGPERQRNLEFGALLHDVGKIAIPKSILHKPGELTPGEWVVMRTHTIEGQKMLDRVGGFMREVGRVVRSHHERWDGCGYPDGLAGDQIPLEARIIASCDAWNAMRTNRPYRRALSYEVARTEILANSGTQFDPRIIAVLLALVAPEAEADRVTFAPSVAATPAEHPNTAASLAS
jgi:putative nucleotidyltransferase with HDIG domain